MKVVKSSESVVITLDQLREHLKAKRGILLWLKVYDNEVEWRILKSPYQSAVDGNKYTYGWVSLYFNRGRDNTSMTISSTEELITFMTRQLEKTGDQFHWFPSEHDFHEWIRTERR